MRKIGFIGTGHMGGTIARAISKDPNNFLFLNNRTKEKVDKLVKEIGRNAQACSLEDIFKNCDIIFIGVKPIDLDSLLDKIKEYCANKIIISMVAGSTIKDIEAIIGKSKIIRILPNTPILVGEGITFVSYNSKINKADIEEFLSVMKLTGDVIEIEEDKINSASVITGSAPAYLDYFLDALIKAGINLGLSEDESRDYVIKMAKGSIDLLVESNKTPIELCDEVCSPGGSTIEGVNLMKDNNFIKIVEKACEATFNKNNKMK